MIINVCKDGHLLPKGTGELHCTNEIGTSVGNHTQCTQTLNIGQVNHPWPVLNGTGWYWICGNKAHKMLPLGWKDICTFGALVPNITITDKDQVPLRINYLECTKWTLNGVTERPDALFILIKVVECLQMYMKSGNKHKFDNAQLKMTHGDLKKSGSNLLHGYPAALGYNICL